LGGRGRILDVGHGCHRCGHQVLYLLPECDVSRKDSEASFRAVLWYVVREGLGKRWWPLAIAVCRRWVNGHHAAFQVNQLVQIGARSWWPNPPAGPHHKAISPLTGDGLLIAALVLLVTTGQIQRVGRVTLRMVADYGIAVSGDDHPAVDTVCQRKFPAAFQLIITDAFSGEAVAGGAIGTVILMGVRRGAFSNEAGIGNRVHGPRCGTNQRTHSRRNWSP